MKRINNSDINFLLSPKTFNISNFTIKFYTVNAEQFYITKTQDNVRVVEHQTDEGETIVDYYLSLDWSELVTLGEGVLQYRLINNFDDAERPDNYYNQSLERTTQYYIDSNIIVDEDEAESYAEIIAELGDKIDGEITRSTSADTLQTEALNSEIQIRQDQINDILDDLSNYYTKDETYNRNEVDAKIEDIDVSEQLKDYLKISSFTESEQVLSGAIDTNKSDISTLANQITNEVTNRENADSELSNKINAKLDISAYTPTDLSNYYTKSETSGATEISTALGEKQNVLTEGRAIDITSNVISLDLPISAGTGTNSIIEGSGTTANGQYSHAEGLKTSASGDWSHTEGYNTTASGNFSHAEGNNTTASGIYGSHAEGDSTTASTRSSHAEGFKTTASGNQSHAEGNNTKANGNVSHAEGQNTVASGQRSHAEGESTSAVTTDSHAEGYSTSASGWASHAEGNSTKATGASSHAEGFNTITNNEAEHASGRYNISNKASATFGDSGNTLFSVGNGTSETSHNAFEIRQNGDIYFTLDGQDVKLQDNLGGGGGSSYTAGDGINITNNVISVTGKQDTLVSGTNIKTINNQSLLGSGNITIQGGSGSDGFITVINPSADTKVGLVNSLSQYYDTNIGKGAVIEGDGYEANGTTNNIVASGEYSHAEGYYTLANGNYSHAEGSNTQASGSCSHAEGSNTKAIGNFSHAEGSNTTASGDYGSHAEGQSTVAVGICSHAEGQNTMAIGEKSHAEGQGTTAVTISSHAEGYSTQAIGDYGSHAEGQQTKAIGSHSHAEGYYTTASGSSSHAEGYSTHTIGNYGSHAEGQNTQASGDYGSHAEGQNTIAIGYSSHAEGQNTIANNEAEHASGRYNVSSSASTTFGDSGNTLFSVGNGTYQNKHNAFEIRQNGDIYITSGSTDIKLQDHLGGGGGGFITVTNPDTAETKVGLVNSLSQYYDTNIGKGAVIEGEGYVYDGTNYNIVASGNYSHAEGFNTTASGNYSHAEGSYTTASGNYGSHAEGYRTTASGSSSHAEGSSTKAIGDYSHAEGNYTTASGTYSHAEGSNTKANGNYSHAEGNYTTASTWNSHAEGYYAQANGGSSHAEGYYTVASGDYSHAEGNNTKANGSSSHAEGQNTVASGFCSHAEGAYGIQAIGYYSHAEGCNGVTANGEASHAEGKNSVTANGEASHAEGKNSVTANGEASHAEGYGTIANNMAEHASGIYNVSSSASTTFGDSGNTLFSVGNGTYENKHNAFEIRQNGDIYITSGSTDIKLQDHLGGNADLSNYYTKTEVNEIVDDVIAGQIDLTTYAKIDWVQTNYALKTDVPKIWSGSESEYNAITNKDSSTIYFIK